MAALTLGACAQQAGPQPLRSPSPPAIPAELVLVHGETDLQVVEVRDGTRVADLGNGLLAARLTAGGDFGEAYLAGAAVSSVRPGRPFVVTKLAELPSPAVSAVLVPAPGLKTYVGDRTVLVVAGRDGVATGFQHGVQLWRRHLGALTQVGDVAVVAGEGGTWSRLAPESGEQISVSGPCSPGPVAEVDGALSLDCSGRPAPWVLKPLASPPLLVWRDGAVTSLVKGGQVSLGRLTKSPTGPPAVSPDGSAIFAPIAGGLLVQAPGQGSGYVIAEPGTASVGVSRDGSLLYLRAGGDLVVVQRGTGRRLARYPVLAGRIELVAGG